MPNEIGWLVALDEVILTDCQHPEVDQLLEEQLQE